MEYRTEHLILRTVTEDDLTEVARTWPSPHRPVPKEEALGAIVRMKKNHARNGKGSLYHLCLAVCSRSDPGTVMGWCGLDGSRSRTVPEIFILLDEPYRGRGCGTECVRELLRIAVGEYALEGVRGGCAKDNPASARAMEKGGMTRCGTEDNGDPLFIYRAPAGSE